MAFYTRFLCHISSHVPRCVADYSGFIYRQCSSFHHNQPHEVYQPQHGPGYGVYYQPQAPQFEAHFRSWKKYTRYWDQVQLQIEARRARTRSPRGQGCMYIPSGLDDTDDSDNILAGLEDKEDLEIIGAGDRWDPQDSDESKGFEQDVVFVDHGPVKRINTHYAVVEEDEDWVGVECS
ncbi:hypothetical protein BGW36DRAFT_442171 [Talaromyces proteolyticus]|uniref:Uncharacterized protein n=1 Tax=Talaromyces proteolyticus TaxID=1131652 RepID=A0AAD4KDJ3_9EURO|nr:uncharacterized protein BGW36DRAFT_442171 [Talaromyces proteolyticus]KAH8689016.1 hypothetical protein BGW36DRAFT_442171 [Talaromyces proteolyticus]